MASEFDEVLDQESAGTLPPLSSGLEKGEFDDVLDTEVSQQRDYVRNVIDIASKDNPEAAADRIRLSQSTGLPPDVVARNQQELKRREIARAIDLQRMMRDSPVLFRQMTDPTFTAAAIDDLGPLGKLESAVADVAQGARALASGLPRLSQGMYGTLAGGAGVLRAALEPFSGEDAPIPILPANPAAPLEQALLGIYKGQADLANTVAGDQSNAGFVGRAVLSGLESLGQNLPMMAAAVVAGQPELALYGMSASSAGQAYGTAREKGIDPARAASYALLQGYIEKGTEEIPVAQLFKDLGAGAGFWKTLANQLPGELVGEQVATLFQDLNDWAVLNPEKPFSSYVEERGPAAVQTLIATLVGTGGNVAVAQGVDYAMRGAERKVQRAMADAQRLQAAMAAAAQSKLRERAPETFQQLAEQMDGGSVYIDGQVLAQSGVDIAQVFPSLAEQVKDAEFLKSTVEIPLAEALTAVPGTDLEEVFLQNAKSAPDALSRAEVEQAGEQGQQFIQQEAERVLQQAQDQSVWQSEVDTVQQTIKGQLDQAGRFTSDVNEGYARLQSQFFSVMASRFGITPTEMYQRFSVKVAGQMGQGEVLNAGADQTQTPEFKNWFGDSKVVDAEGRPLVVYHGTPYGALEIVDPDEATSNSGAVFFTSDKSVAEDFASGEGITFEDGYKVKPHVVEAYLSIQNPAVYEGDVSDEVTIDELMEAVGLSAADVPSDLQDELGIDMPVWRWYSEYSSVFDVLRKNGFDGFVAKERGKTMYALFDSTQIKSATGNSGAFDPNDPNILRQSALADDAVDEASDDAPSAIEQADVPTSVDDAAALSSALRVATSSIWRKGRDLKVAIQNAVQAAARAAGVDVGVESPQSEAYLVRVGLRDALDALKQNANAVGWYDLKTRQALAVMSLVHPELATDEDARLAFVWIMAVTSNGLKVGKNFELAETAYRRYKQDGRMPTDVGVGNASKAINDSLGLFDTLKTQWGSENLRKFMLTPFLVEEISALSKDLTPGGEHADVEVRGAAILGPKIGNGFFSNLYGNFDALTMDRWLIRTWGRWSGTLIKDMPRHTAEARARVREVMAKIEANPAERDRLSALISHTFDTSTEAGLDAIALAVQKASMKPNLRAEMNKTDVGSELRLSGNGLAKYLDGQKEAPSGPWERKYIRRVFQGILAELKSQPEYANLTMADLQAVLWYAEKRLYEAAKTDLAAEDEVDGYEDDEAPDYANAAVDVARSAGVSERKIQNALKREENGGRSATARSADNEQTGSQGQPRETGGFTGSEKREFRATVAIHRARRIRSTLTGDERSPWTYTGRSGTDGPRVRVLKKLGIKYTEQWKAGTALARTLKNNGQKVPTFYELDSGSADKFRNAIAASKAASPFGAAVYVYPLEEYQGMRLFLSEEGAGFALKSDGDIVSVFGGGGTGHATMDLAITLGGRKLDCFDTVLPDIYAVHGFVGAARLPWDDSQAPEGWSKQTFAKYNDGQPDVVFMAYDPTSFAPYAPNAGARVSTYNGALRVQSRVVREGQRSNVLAQSAYHGTPHRGIDKFSTDFIGTGEGAQAYGWGLYFASKREIAEHYRKVLSDQRKLVDADGNVYTPEDIGFRYLVAQRLAINDGDYEKTAETIRSLYPEDTISTRLPTSGELLAELQKLKDAGIKAAPVTGGQLYEVDIPEDSEMLDWDTPVPDEVLRKVAEESIRLGLLKGDIAEAISILEDEFDRSGAILYRGLSEQLGGDKAASQFLSGIGIKGIKYLDGGSRTAGDGSYNYVVFSGDDVAIKNQFYQGQQQQARGTFNPQTLLISLGPQSDLSTFLHESGHFFLEVMADLAAQPDAPAQVREDMDKVLAWFGVPDLATWNTFTLDQKREHHERWAESFEQYLLEGKAPSAELQPLFRRFRSWLVNVYKSLTDFMRGRNLKLNDEIRQVFDRMLATDEAIAQAEEQAGLLPDFDATNEAIERLQERSLRNLKWTLNARSKFLKQFTKEAKELRKGILTEVLAEFEQRPDAMASRAIRKVRNKDGAERDAKLAAIADATGYATVEEMTAAVTALGPVNDAVEAEVDRRMLERHGDMATQEALEAAANEAVHNEARARALAAELKSQDEAMNPRETTGRTDARGRPITVNALVEAARAFGADLAARRAVGKLKNAIYLHRAAEARAGKAWQTATKKGDTKAAVQAKRDQLLNNQAVRALLDAQAEVRSAIEFFRKVTKGNNEKLVKGGRDPDVVNAMRAILGVYGIAPRTGKGAMDYLDLVQKNDPAMYAVIAPGVNTALANAKPFSELTVEEVRGLTDELKSLWHLAKRSRQMEIDGDLLDLEDLADQLYARMEDIGIPDVLPGETGALTDAELRKRNWLQQAPAILRRVEQWAEAKDGAFGGPFLRFIFQPVKIAADRYRADRLVYRQKFQALVDAIAPTMAKTIIAAPELDYTFGRGHNGIGMAEVLHAILHTGNDSNKRKLLLGRNWATENPDGTLDTSRWDAFIARLITEGTLTKAHYDFAQGVWDLMEETKPLAQKTHRDVFGRYFAEVTANEFQTPFGTYRGGYVPAQADPLLVQDADQRELLETENAGMSYAFPATNKGFTKGRVEYNRPLKLDLRTLPQHIDKVLLFSHMEPAVRSVDRLLRRKKIAQALNKIDPAAINGMLKPWLNRSARQTVETPVSADAGMNRMLSQARARTGMALMMGNLSNTLQQITGFSTALLKVKGSHMRRAVAQYIADPQQLKNTVWALSPYMADRASNEVAVLSDTLEAILLNPSVYQSAERFTRRHAYFLQTAMDNQMSPIIWTGAYNQALAEGMEDRMARRYADGVIRQTQGSTLPEDVSRIETGTAFARAFTQFVGYFNMLANTNATALKQIAQQQGLRKGAGKAFGVLMLGMMIPIWVAEVIAQAFRGGPEDDEDDGYLDDWLAAVFGFGTIRGILSGVPVIAQMGQSMVNRFNDNPADDKFSLSPTVSVLESAVAAPHSVYKAIFDEGSAQKAVRDMSALITLRTGLPAMTLARPLGYAAGVAQGKIEPTGPVDAARGVITGTASPESKNP